MSGKQCKNEATKNTVIVKCWTNPFWWSFIGLRLEKVKAETRSINQSSVKFLLGIKLNGGNSRVMGLRAEFRHLLGILAVSGVDGQLHGEGEKGKERERERQEKS